MILADNCSRNSNNSKNSNNREVFMRVADMHCDTIERLYSLREQGGSEVLRENTLHVDLLRMKESGYLIQNFALFVQLERDGDPWERVCRLQEYYEREMERNSDLIAPVYRFSDIAENDRAGRMSALLTVEEGAVCKGEIEKLRRLYRLGVRMMTLTWNFPNELGRPNFTRGGSCWEPDLTHGLTERGKEFVAEMEALGMIPDVSHLSDAGFYDVLAVTRKPFVASHSNARSVCPWVRNMTDDMIRRLSERGGVMGLNFCADFLETVPQGRENFGTVAAVVRHAKHITKVGGMDVLGLGSDFDGIDTHRELPGAQSMDVLWEALKKAGFTEDQLDRIFWGNVLRVYREDLA